MSEPTARPAAPPKGAGGKKILGVNRTTAIVFGVALFAALAWALYKRSKAAKTATTATTPANASGECTDANGNSIPCDEDFAGQLSAIQTELESALAGQGGTGTTTTTTTGTGTSAGTGGSALAVQIPNGSGGYMTAVFPSQAQLDAFYTAVGVTGGAFPNGLSYAQLAAAVTASGGTITGGAGQAGSSTGTSGGSALAVQVPNGKGGYMTAVFPSQAALNSFYSAIGVTGGAYPNGLSYAQLAGAVTAAGGRIAAGGQ